MTRQQPPAQENTKHILIIDDDSDALLVLKTLLKASHYTVETASNGEDGLRKVARRMPDLIILDIMMPGVNGIEVTRKLKANRVTATIPLIMLTAVDERKYMKAALFELDVDYYITKPFDQDQLLDKIRQAIRYRRIPPDAV